MGTSQGLEESGMPCSISEFGEYLQKPDLSSKQNESGWVFWNSKTENELGKDFSQPITIPSEKEKIMCVLEAATSDLGNMYGVREYMVQFWGMKEGYLTTVDQPFAAAGLLKGFCWYRKLCEAHPYSVKEGASEEVVGAVGRAYLNGSPESTPDLRLYSINEFPLRNEAGSYGLRSYVALPLFDLLREECFGVLELVSRKIGPHLLFFVDRFLKKAGFRSTHIGLSSIKALHETYTDQEPESEILNMMKSATEIVPQLHLVQVWSPCKQCVNTTDNLSCMQRIDSRNPGMCTNYKMGEEIRLYDRASEFHHLQIGKWIGKPLTLVDRKSCFCRNICDFDICENPLAHYARRARLSFCFVAHLQNVHNSNNYLVEFFFQSNSSEDGCDASFLHLLLQIMKMELTNFKFEESIVELRKTSAHTEYEYVEWKHQNSHSEEVNMLKVMKGHTERYSLKDFKKYLQTPNLSYLQPLNGSMKVCLFWREEISNSGVSLPNIPTQEEIKKLMIAIATNWGERSYRLVQFWALGMKEDRPCLETSDQPFVLGSLDMGLAFFRKKCMECHYFLDEEVGPLQRVFRSGHPESSPDLRLYSTTEFPLRNHALHCLLRKYIAFPIFNQHKKCIGVLEYVGVDDDYEIGTSRSIERAIQAKSHGFTHINFMRGPTRQVDPSQRLADTEISSALTLFKDIPQLFQAKVRVVYKECDGVSGNICSEPLLEYNLGWPVNFRPVQFGKGIVGMVLASENKSCFCRNLCNFSIADEPLAHYSQRDRVDVCFAICLQSSHTSDLQYILQFFLFQGPAKLEYLSSFLHILFPILKKELTSFKVASGQQLGDDLVVEVIEFPRGNKLSTSSESYSPPFKSFKFKTVHYGRKETQHSNDELCHSVPNVMSSVPSLPRAKPSNAVTSNSREKDVVTEKLASNSREKDVVTEKLASNSREKDVVTEKLASNSREEDEVTEKLASNSREKDEVTEKSGKKRSSSVHMTLEDLEPHFGTKTARGAEELGVGRSTIKRAYRELYVNNRSPFEVAGTPQAFQHSQSTNHPPMYMLLLPPPYANTSVQPSPYANMSLQRPPYANMSLQRPPHANTSPQPPPHAKTSPQPPPHAKMSPQPPPYAKMSPQPPPHAKTSPQLPPPPHAKTSPQLTPPPHAKRSLQPPPPPHAKRSLQSPPPPHGKTSLQSPPPPHAKTSLQSPPPPHAKTSLQPPAPSHPETSLQAPPPPHAETRLQPPSPPHAETSLQPPPHAETSLQPPLHAETSLQAVADLNPESETVMVKAKYEDEIIKFNLCLSSTMNNLLQEVARRLGLEAGSFKLRYLDEDDDKILLACDEDLQLFLKSVRATKKTTVQIFIQLIP